MSTRSNIGIINEDGSVDVIYCHWDGYPCHNGALLLHHYKEEDKVRRLMRLGDISYHAEKLEPAPGQEHTYDKPVDGVVVAYMRDFGDKDAVQRGREAMAVVPGSGRERRPCPGQALAGERHREHPGSVNPQPRRTMNASRHGQRPSL